MIIPLLQGLVAGVRNFPRRYVTQNPNKPTQVFEYLQSGTRLSQCTYNLIFISTDDLGSPRVEIGRDDDSQGSNGLSLARVASSSALVKFEEQG